MVVTLWSILTFVCFLQICNCSGVVELRLDRYSFSCKEFWGDNCDLMFTFCFDKPDRSPNFDACEYKRTPFSSYYTNQNDITFGSDIGGLPNPIVIGIPSFEDPRIMVAIRVYDKDDTFADDFVGEIQLTLKLAPAANISIATFVTSSKNYNGHFIQYAYRAYCNSSQYGAACDVTCIARNDSNGHYSCSDQGQKVCYTGWEGGNCTTDINECTIIQGTCSKGNTTKDTASNVVCINTPGSYHCECVIGWKGDNCTTDIDECSSSNQTICQNGGTCSNNVGSYTCNCSSTWTGQNCSQDVDECTNPTTCHHYPGNRMCFNMAGSFQCVCQTGWKGDNCTSDIDECISVNETVCYNGGICNNTNGSYLCECPSNWTGINCTQDVDECSNTSPQNNTCNLLPGHHTCVNTLGAFHCECATGWKGDNCTTDIDECSESKSTVCYNGGVCNNEPGSYRCNCPRNWTGQNCTEDVDECNTALVETECKKFPGNWACTNFPGSYICQCRSGWQGDNCTDDINECSSLSQMPCYNGGDCFNLNGSYRCECPSNWTGQNCSEDVDECAIYSNGSSLCLEMNKLCQNTMGGFVCACGKGWKGDNCTVDVDECNETINECHNGTKCINTMGGFNCDCPSGWGGKNCNESCNGKSIADGDTSQNEDNITMWPIIVVTAILFIAIVVSVIILSRRQRKKQKSTLDHLPHATDLQAWSSIAVTFHNNLYDVMPTQKHSSTLDPVEGILSQNSDNDGDTYQEDKAIYHEVDNEYNNLEPTATPVQTLQNTITKSDVSDFNVYDLVGDVQPVKDNPYSNVKALRSVCAKTQPPVDQRGYAHLLSQDFSSNRGLKTENNHNGLKREKAPKQLDQEFQLLNYGFENEDGQREFILSKLERSQYMETHLAPSNFSGATEAMPGCRQNQAYDYVKTGFDDRGDGETRDDCPPESVDQLGLFQGLGGVRGYQHLSSEDYLEPIKKNAREHFDEAEVKNNSA